MTAARLVRPKPPGGMLFFGEGARTNSVFPTRLAPFAWGRGTLKPVEVRGILGWTVFVDSSLVFIPYMSDLGFCAVHLGWWAMSSIARGVVIGGLLLVSTSIDQQGPAMRHLRLVTNGSP